jgi:hypothetical protein
MLSKKEFPKSTYSHRDGFRKVAGNCTVNLRKIIIISGFRKPSRGLLAEIGDPDMMALPAF